MSAAMCLPGQRLCRYDDSHIPGTGTYVRNGYIYSSLAGCKVESTAEEKLTVEVKTDVMQNVVPTIDAIVTAKVTNVNPRFAKSTILSVGKTALKEHFHGQIRKEDVRATEKDRVDLYKCFRPGDIVVARILSLGDAHSYLLTTAENELGVVMATSEAGASMVPISWCKMKCTKTLAEEHRKVAKVQPQFIAKPETGT